MPPISETNPYYEQFNTLIGPNLDDIGNAMLAAGADISTLNLALVTAIKGDFNYTTTDLPEIDMESILIHAKNAYINNNFFGTPGQMSFNYFLLKHINNVPPLQIKDYITNIEENIEKSELPMSEKIPLFFATAVGSIMFDYWLIQINQIIPLVNTKANITLPWTSLINSNAAINTANLPYWISAAMFGALYFTYKGSYTSSDTQPPKIAGPCFVTALTACLGLVAGVICFKWMPRVNLVKQLR
jgi:hypothetical protein